MGIDITVVTVCYNVIEAGRKEMLIQCMDSVQSQTGVRLQHLIVDGASTDGTCELIGAYKAKNHEVRLVSEPDKGIYDAMNKGLHLADGDYIIYLNSDDYYHNEQGLKASLEIVRETGCAYSFAPIYMLWEGKKRNKHVDPCTRLYKFFFHSVLSHQSILASTQVLRELGGFDLSYKSAADYDLELRLVMGGYKGCYVPLEFVSYRMIGQSSVNVGLSQKESARSLQQNYNRFLSVDMSDDEAMYLHLKHRLPSKYRNLFSKLLFLSKQSFVGVEMSVCEELRYNLSVFVSRLVNNVLSYA